MKILVLVAHPDDETIIAGGTIDKLIKAGHQVTVCYVTKNEQAYYDSESQKARIRRTEKEVLHSSQILGFKIDYLHFVDMELVNNKGKLMQTCIHYFRKVLPDVIITHHKGDKHIDHRTLGEIVPEANFQSGCKLCGGELVWSAKLVLQGEIDLEMTTPFDFQVVSSLKKLNTIQKIKAFDCYSSVKDEHKTDLAWLHERLLSCASLRGKSINAEYGEAFLVNNYSPISPEGLAFLVEVMK